MRPTIFAVLIRARAILEAQHFAMDEAALLLDGMLLGDFDPHIRDAVVHTRNVVTAGETAVARFALARLITLLEKHVKLRVVS